jgi:hypothetical protein
MRILAAAATLLLLLVANSVRLAREPSFAAARQRPARDSLRIEGVKAALRDDAAIVVSASSGQMGHERLGPFWFGIPTFFALRNVIVTSTDPNEAAEWLRSEHARWTPDAIELEGPVWCRRGGREFVAKSAEV